MALSAEMLLSLYTGKQRRAEGVDEDQRGVLEDCGALLGCRYNAAHICFQVNIMAIEMVLSSSPSLPPAFV